MNMVCSIWPSKEQLSNLCINQCFLCCYPKTSQCRGLFPWNQAPFRSPLKHLITLCFCSSQQNPILIFLLAHPHQSLKRDTIVNKSVPHCQVIVKIPTAHILTLLLHTKNWFVAPYYIMDATDSFIILLINIMCSLYWSQKMCMLQSGSSRDLPDQAQLPFNWLSEFKALRRNL